MSNEVNQAFLRAYVKNRADRALQGTPPVAPQPPSVIRRDVPKQGDSIRIDQATQLNSEMTTQQIHGQPRSAPAPHIANTSTKERAPQLNRPSPESPNQEHQGGVWSPIGVERGMKGTNRSNSAPAVVVNAPRNDSVPNVARVSSRTLASESPKPSSSPAKGSVTGSQSAITNRGVAKLPATKIRVDAAHSPAKNPHSSDIVVRQSLENSFQVAPSIVVNDHLHGLRDRMHSGTVMPNAPIIAGAGIATPRPDVSPVVNKTATATTNRNSPIVQPKGPTDRTSSHPASRSRPMPQSGDIHVAETKLPEPKLGSGLSDRSTSDRKAGDRKASDRPLDRSSLEQGTSVSNLPLPIAFSPSWEVDRFIWPDVLKQIENSDVSAFQAISKHLRLANQDGLKVISVTSGERGVGRSTVAMHLARCAAASGLKVALVDADGFHPSLIDQLKLDLEHGWQECLFENIPLEEVAIRSLGDNMTLFPLTSVIPTQQLHVNLHRMAKIVKRIALAFDMVFLDSNRLNLEQRDLIGVSQDRVIDAAIVVTDSELSVKEKVDTAVSILHGMGIASVGIVQNFHS
ncbi:MAG: P-loop NTPase [Pirellula sp.]|nr:P-loop NTPase [Pirellula sp.]